MEYAFFEQQHDRAGHLRAGDQWRAAAGELQVMVISGEHVASTGGTSLRWMQADDAPDGQWIFLGNRDGKRFAVVVVERLPDELEPISLREIGPKLTQLEASLAVHAVGLARWHHNHQYCARCGHQTTSIAAGHHRECQNCGRVHFPRTDPAVIMLITDAQDRALLGRQASWNRGRFSTLAGFVEPGETLADAVRREVVEEVGVLVGEVKYAGSQPWPFPSSLMVGFFGAATTDQITVDEVEIAEARWFTREEVTESTASGELQLPSNASISRFLIQTWHGGVIHGSWTATPK